MKVSESTYKAMPPKLQALFRKLPNPGSEEVAGLFPESDHARGNISETNGGGGMYGHPQIRVVPNAGDSGSAARFFYCAKASRKDREEGLEGMPKKFLATMGDGIGVREHNKQQPTAYTRNPHPTVKPTALMRWLCRLVTPPGGLILDPFMGSGSTGKAAVLEGFRFIGIDIDPEYVKIAKARIAHATNARAETLF